MTVQELPLADIQTYHIEFSSKRKPIVIARAMKHNGKFFWTSIPEGRQKEAEGVGKLIDDYNKKKEN